MQPAAPADPVPMRSLKLPASALAALAAAALGLAAGGCGSGSPAATLDPIAQAADVTSHAGGSQVAISVSVQVPGLGAPITMKGGGHFNNARREGQLTLEADGLAAALPGASGGTLTITELMKGGAIYMSSPLFDGKLPGGARWLKIDLGKAAASLGIDPQALTSGSANPADILSYLKGSTGAPKIAGHEAVRGVPTTRYEGTVSLDAIAEQLPAGERAKTREAIHKLSSEIGTSSFPVTVWIDAHHLVRRMTMDLRFSAAGQSGSVQVEVEDFGFGPTPSVTPPTRGETFDATGLSSAGLSQGG